PPILLAARAFLDRLELSLDVSRPLRMLALGLVQRRLGFGRSLLAPFTVPFPGSLLAPALSVTTLLLLLEFGSGLSGVLFAYLPRPSLRWLGATALPTIRLLCGSHVGGQDGVLR